MSKIVGCVLIVKDDFENSLILQKKVKRNEPEEWCLIHSKLKGKESYDKSINRGVKDCIKALAFDLETIGECVIDKENDESVMVYVGNIKEKPMLDKAYIDYTWINRRQIDKFNLSDWEKDLLRENLK